jgi:hypothetical protein
MACARRRRWRADCWAVRFAELLDSAQIRRADATMSGPRIWLINSLREWIDAVLA